MTTSKNDEKYHVPVLLEESIKGLNIKPDGVYIDLTFGGGGHSKSIANLLSSKGLLIGFDQDEAANNNTWEASNFKFIPANFSFFKNHLRALGIKKADGIIADLGVSSYQFNTPKRGFSFRFDEPLDMRMNQKATLSAYNVLNEYEEVELIRLFKEYGELKKTYKIVQLICSSRSEHPIKTTGQLVQLLLPIAPKHKSNKFFAQLFQAIRIEVNNEMESLKKMLIQAADVLNKEGRLVVLTYHSIEDRLVKNFMKRGSFDGVIEKDFYGNILKPLIEINRKPIVASEEEVERNGRARSAKLRIAKKDEGE